MIAPMLLASRCGHAEIVQFLCRKALVYHISVDIPDNLSGMTSLMVASESGFVFLCFCFLLVFLFSSHVSVELVRPWETRRLPCLYCLVWVVCLVNAIGEDGGLCVAWRGDFCHPTCGIFAFPCRKF